MPFFFRQRSRRRSHLPLHVGRLRTAVLFSRENDFGPLIFLGSFVEESRNGRRMAPSAKSSL